MNLFCQYSFWFARMRSDSPKTSITPELMGRLNRCALQSLSLFSLYESREQIYYAQKIYHDYFPLLINHSSSVLKLEY